VRNEIILPVEGAATAQPPAFADKYFLFCMEFLMPFSVPPPTKPLLA
jgi:hypothetical protein